MALLFTFDFIFVIFVSDKISKDWGAGEIFSTITFLRSVGSTDQNALLNVPFV